MRILIAEDNPVTATYIRTVFERKGWLVDVVLDGARAIEQVEKERYDAVLVDWILPRYDGIDVLRTIRQQQYEIPPYVAIVTVVDSLPAKQYCLACGANGYFTKPIDPEAVIASIEEYYRNVRNVAQQ
ncbi:MAG: response regulator transcription factor [Bacteroidota bacterium]|nr:response regulator transcription factor [Candidatus Kapabacteria bacterium]MCS7302696.1 response regulator transcription factor [Candidatus Kapabacteria bacterium]MCX7936204.1 response regulator transcription factor [Chlorobiota bacterium]MDW8074902.1 response regulator transcription factor [Bacteroidota bacterium]MDW8271541.1 response regulator transcription factor [Bacteroidota bacterium]